MRSRLTLLALLFCAPLQAHDFWIEPSTFHPVRGVLFTAALKVGQNFTGDAVPRSTPLIDTFAIRDANGARPVSGLENRDPAGYVRMEAGGAAIIGYSSRPSSLEITSAKFAQFLREEGLEEAVPAGAKAEEPHREQFIRYAKSIVRMDGAPERLSSPLGYRLEIVPVRDPFARGPISFRVLFDQKPRVNALVTAIAHDDPSQRIQARTNARGEVTLPIGSGVWLVKTTSIVRAPASASVQWETLWASLTFER